MPLIWILLLAAWTFVVLRLLGMRATLSSRVLGSYLMLGALAGLVLMPLVRFLVAPYGEQGTGVTELVSLSCQALLLLPVLWYLFFHRACEVTSVADAFLLAFAVGFGFDLAGALLAGAAATTPIKGLSFLPPWEFDGDKFAVAGYGYWTGLVVLTIASVRRFVRNRYFAISAGALVFFLVATEQASLLYLPQEKPDNWLGTFGNLTFHGSLTAWIALIALLALTILEARWAGPKKESGSSVRFPFIEELQLCLKTLSRGKFGEMARLGYKFHLRRQAALAAAESQRSPDNQRLRDLAGRLQQMWQQIEPGAAPASSPRKPFWRSYHIGQIAVTVVLATVVIFPKDIGGFFWSLPLLHFQLAGVPTLLCTALIALIAWRYVSAAGRPGCADDAADLAGFLGEKAILQLSLLAALLVFLFPQFDSLYPFPSLVSGYSGVRLPGFEAAQATQASHHVQLATLLLLFATLAGSLSLPGAARWRQAPPGERRRVALRRAVGLAGFYVIVWLSLAVYGSALEWSHHTLGALFYKIQRWFSLKETFGTTGNTLGAWIAAFSIALLSVGVWALTRIISNRLEKFLLGESAPQPQPALKEQARAAVGGAGS